MLIIPAIDIIDGQCVRLTKGKYDTKKIYAKDPVKIAKDFANKGAEMLHIVDLDGAREGKAVNLETVLKIRKAINIPIQIGGGIRNILTAYKYLDNGINRIIIGTKAVGNPTFSKTLIKKFDPKRIVVSIDARNDKISTKGWQEELKIDYLDFAMELKKLGIKEVIFTDITRDGTLKSPNLTPFKNLKKLGFNVIAAGGISDTNAIKNLRKIGIKGAIIGKALYENKLCLSKLLPQNNLTKRIIACMDIRDGRVVKGTNFKNLHDCGDPVKLGKLYNKMGVDELVFLDITATVEKRKTLCKLVEKIAKEINIPFTVGGGISSIEDIRAVLKSGADKVSIGSTAVENPSLVKEAAAAFGSQCIVISIDPRRKNNSWEIYTRGGRTNTGINAIKFAKQMEELGAGELLVNSLDRDGTKEGFDIPLLKEIAKNVNIPIIASSGAGKKEHFLEAFKEGQADAALAASLFHYGKLSIPNLKKYLIKNNVKIRS